MKKVVSLILTAALCLTLTAGLTACHKNNLTSEQNHLVEEVASDIGFTPEEENLEVVSAINGDENSASVIKDTGNEVSYIIADDGAGTAVEMYASNVADYDFDGDGKDEVIMVGPSTKYDTFGMVTIYDYDSTPFFADKETEGMNFVARCFVSDSPELTLGESDDGIHVFNKGKDLGVASFNGPHLEISNYNVISEPTDKPDMSLFDPPYITRERKTGSYSRVYYFNGELIEVPDDFIYRWDNPLPANTSTIISLSFDITYLEKLSGQKMKSLGKDFDSKAIVTVYGKKYVSMFNISDYFDMEFSHDVDSLSFTTNDYKAAAENATEVN